MRYGSLQQQWQSSLGLKTRGDLLVCGTNCTAKSAGGGGQDFESQVTCFAWLTIGAGQQLI